MDFNYEYLKELLQEVNDLRNTIAYTKIDENDYDEITYIANRNDTSIGVQQGLSREYNCKKYKFKEKSSIRKGSMYYCKTYKKEGKTIRVDSYTGGKVNVIFIAYYKENKRFLFPFSSDGSFYPTYSYVTHYNNGLVSEEYCANNVQIIYEHYLYNDNNTVRYDYINYVPNGSYPVLEKSNGLFVLTPELQYYTNQISTWRDDIK